jgi:hypothetical protein
MSMSARDRQALSSIEDVLSESDPLLAAMLDEFSRRTAGAAMPAVERIGGKWLRGLTRRFTRQRPRCRRAKWPPAVVVWWLVVCAVVAVELAVFNGGISRQCPGLVALHCATGSLLQR